MEEKSILKREIQRGEQRRRAALAAEIIEDFEQRRCTRRQIELGWQLNLNFTMGNQYVGISPRGEVEETERDFYWQEREVFNHLAPIIETRLAKLGRVRPSMKVVPFSGSDEDLFIAKMSTAILKSAQNRLELDSIIANATMWSEITGSAFYKIVWNGEIGEKIDKDVAEGDVEVRVCPPFEIFPDSLSAQNVCDCRSIIHARAMSVGEINDIYKINCAGENVDIFDIQGNARQGGMGYSTVAPSIGKVQKKDYCLVIERYSMPNTQFPNGRLEIVAGRELVFEGDLPYANLADGARGLPFIRQVSIETPHCFYGTSILDRCIPIQRAFNAIKNRKHEFMNRLAMGVLMVEDGSVDTDSLEEEGLSPGKVMVYRQGSHPPIMMDMGRVPAEFAYEEDRLLNEFTHITGVSEIMRNSQVPSSITSGIALQLLIEQDDTRLSVTAERIRNAVRTVSQHILRLYKQFAVNKRLARISGNRGVEAFYWCSSNLGSDDIAFVTENELNETPAAKRNMVFELLKAGLLHDENGKLSNSMRSKVLDLLGYGLWEQAQDMATLHEKRAASENLELGGQALEPQKIDDHDIHIREHTRYLLAEKTNMQNADNYYAHIQMHETMNRLNRQTDLSAGGIDEN